LPRPKKSFSPEFKDEAVKMVIETSRPIARVAKELGINEGTLGNWVNVYRREHANAIELRDLCAIRLGVRFRWPVSVSPVSAVAAVRLVAWQFACF
jgi:transposase-like protein